MVETSVGRVENEFYFYSYSSSFILRIECSMRLVGKAIGNIGRRGINFLKISR